MRIDTHSPSRDAGPESGPPPEAPHRTRPDAGCGVLIDLNSVPAAWLPGLTVVVPTRNEEANVALLLERLGPAIAPLDAEIISVRCGCACSTGRRARAGAASAAPSSPVRATPAARGCW